MARDVFRLTVALPVVEPDLNDEVLHPLDNIRISVFLRGTSTAVAIYQRPTGATQGPTPESGGSGTNPFTTSVTGDVEFWCDGPAELDVAVHDLTAPSRIADRTIGWNCLPAGPSSMATAILARDGGIALAHLGADVLRQVIQIGQVIDWWRPANTVPIPSGFVVCEGQSVPPDQHSFPGVASAINVPDLRNMFILGASKDVTDGTGATGADTAAAAPGIRGSGGSQTHTLTAAQHAPHNHGGNTLTKNVDHVHAGATVGADRSLAHNHGLSFVGKALITNAADAQSYPANPAISGTLVWFYGSPWNGGAQPGIGEIDATLNGSTPDHNHAFTTGNADRSLDHNHVINSDGSGTPHNNMPRYVGLLKLMKVKWS